MSELFQYHAVHPTTWVYLSSLLTICVCFKFSRLWSVRNVDILGLVLLAPGLLMVGAGRQEGYLWLFVMGALFLFRLLLDPIMVRRPLLEPNLSVGGLTFLGTALFVFLMTNVINSRPSAEALAEAEAADVIWLGSSAPRPGVGSANALTPPNGAALLNHGPGYPPLFSIPNLAMQPAAAPAVETSPDRDYRPDLVRTILARTLAIASHLAVVLGIVFIGYRHFENAKTGIAAATLYLLTPYTAEWTGHVEHVLPAALLIWAVAAYRRPFVAGLLLGLAACVLYPIFLLPLWLGFYWPRGLWRFSSGVAVGLGVMILSLALFSGSFWPQMQQLFGLPGVPANGFWGAEYINKVYRIPVIAAFLALCGTLCLWPAQKNLGTLMSCSAAVMVAAQFWMACGGGVHVAWYLPLLLLTVFRPNLEDRVALNAIGPRRLAFFNGVERAA